MPIIPNDNFSNWYLVTLDNSPIIVQSYNETLEQETQDVKYLQGDIGNHVVSIGPQKYKLSLSSPMIILDHDNSNDEILDIYDFSLGYLNKLQKPVSSSFPQMEYVLKSINIQLGQESSINTLLEGWESFASSLNAVQYRPNELDFIARLVKNYDIQISMFNENFLITNGTLNISVNSSANYYVSNTNDTFGNKTPLYAILGYSVTGDVTLMLTPDQYDMLKFYNDQNRGIFVAAKHNVYLTILDRFNPNRSFRRIDLGNFMFLPSAELNISSNQIITARFNFVTMFRGTSKLTY